MNVDEIVRQQQREQALREEIDRLRNNMSQTIRLINEAGDDAMGRASERHHSNRLRGFITRAEAILAQPRPTTVSNTSWNGLRNGVNIAKRTLGIATPTVYHTAMSPLVEMFKQNQAVDTGVRDEVIAERFWAGPETPEEPPPLVDVVQEAVAHQPVYQPDLVMRESWLSRNQSTIMWGVGGLVAGAAIYFVVKALR